MVRLRNVAVTPFATTKRWKPGLPWNVTRSWPSMIVPETATDFELVSGIVEAPVHPNCTRPPAESPALSPASLQEYTAATADEGSASARAASNAPALQLR